MEITDVYSKSIAEGSYVIYHGTCTMGKVAAIKTIDNDIWAKIDSTNLWYRGDTLQVIDKSYGKLAKVSKEDLKEKIRRIKKTVGEDIDMSSELCDGGG